MKKLNLISMLLLFVTVLSVMSCVNDNNSDNSISKLDQKTYQQRISGTYSGKTRLYSFDANTNNFVKQDSTVNVAWTLNADSTMSIVNFPVKFFADYITTSNTTDLVNLKTALAAAPNQNIKAFYCIPSTSYVTSTSINYVVTALRFSLTYNGATHVITIPTNVNYVGGWIISKQFAYVLAITEGLYIDNTDYSSNMTTTAIEMASE